MSVIALRIGACQPVDAAAGNLGPQMLDSFLAEPDLCGLVDKSIEAPEDVDFAILHGISDNRFKRLDLSATREVIGFHPQHDAAEINPQLREVLPDLSED